MSCVRYVESFIIRENMNQTYSIGNYQCGRSTLFKHMKLMYNSVLSKQELIERRQSVYIEIFRVLATIIEEMKKVRCLKLKYWAYSHRKSLNIYLLKIINQENSALCFFF